MYSSSAVILIVRDEENILLGFVFSNGQENMEGSFDKDCALSG